MPGFSLSKGRAKIEGLKFLKAEHIEGKEATFICESFGPPPKGLNITGVMKLKEPLHGRDYFPVSRTNWLMLANSWPHDDTDTFNGCLVKVRKVTTPSPQGGSYTRLHVAEVTEEGKGKKPVKIKELPRRKQQQDDSEPPIDAYGDDVPF